MKFISIFCLMFILCNTVHAQNTIIASILNEVNIDSLVIFTEKISGERAVIVDGNTQIIQSRQHQKIGNELAYKFLRNELIRYGYQIDSLRFSPTGKNLFAIKEGTLFPEYWVILGAHYDNLPLATVAPGADDNASGCAAILEAGRILQNHEFPYTIVFALWDEEELGLVGSSAYIPKIGSKQEKLIGYINLDMIGWDGNNDSIIDIHVRAINHSEALKNKAILANQQYTIGLELNIVNPGTYNSDQMPFWNGGFSAIAINENEINDLNPNIHKVTDKLEHFNLSYFLKSTKLAIATLLELAMDTEYDYGFTDNSNPIQIYPNPWKDKITIRMDTKEKIKSIAISDENGKKVFNDQFDSRKINLQLELNHGIYFVTVVTDSNTYKKRIVKY